MSCTTQSAARTMIDLGSNADALYADPRRVLSDLREQGPVHFVRLPDGSTLWLVVDYQDVLTGLKDTSLRKDWFRASGRIGPNIIGATMLSSDPPDHTRLRRLVSGKFTARRIAALEPRVRQITNELLDAMTATETDRSVHDLVSEFALPLPVTVISELFGVPFLDRSTFEQLCRNVFVTPNDPAQARAHVEDIITYFDQLITDKRQRPADDLLSALIHATDNTDRLTHDELRATTFLLLVAGHATTTNLIANGVLALLDHPDQLAALQADWSLLGGAIEEILRYDGPQAFSTRRFTTTPYTVGDAVIPGGGETIMFALASANHDPTHFPHAIKFDIHRPASTHLAFGHGLHFCLGAPLARLQARTALHALLTRHPTLSLALEGDGERSWRQTLMSHGVSRLPVWLT